MLSLRELERAESILRREIVGSRVQTVSQPDAHTVALELYTGSRSGPERKSCLLLSCSPSTARVSMPEKLPKAPGGPPRFAQYLRAHARGARVEAVSLLGGDRQLVLRLRGRDGDLELLLAIFGRRSNLFALDAEGHIAQALRPLDETRPDLSLGGPFRPPASTAPQVGEDRFEAEPDERFLRAIEAFYAEAETEGAFDALWRRLAGALRKERRAAERKLAKLESQLAGAEQALALEHHGELLKGELGRIERGAREVVVRDHASGEDVRIALDPTLSPSENLERMFKRYRKALRALGKSGAQLEAVRATRDVLAALEADLSPLEGRNDAEGLAALEAFAARDEVARLLTKYAPSPPPARRPDDRVRRVGKLEIPARLAPRRYRTESGLEIWVGRSDAGNDYLTTRLARGKDLFFHLDGAPGSHVILRTEGRSDPPSAAVLDACELAVHFSKFKKATRADVHVVPIKNVRKPKGAKPGLVMVHGGRSIHLRRMATRLERILAARIDEKAEA